MKPRRSSSSLRMVHRRNAASFITETMGTWIDSRIVCTGNSGNGVVKDRKSPASSRYIIEMQLQYHFLYTEYNFVSRRKVSLEVYVPISSIPGPSSKCILYVLLSFPINSGYRRHLLFQN